MVVATGLTILLSPRVVNILTGGSPLLPGRNGPGASRGGNTHLPGIEREVPASVSENEETEGVINGFPGWGDGKSFATLP